jgi:phage tail-like protein
VPPFSVNPHRVDPYKSFKFRLKWDGRYVAGVSHVSALARSTEVVEHRSGADPNAARRSPGRTVFHPVVLGRGVTHDNEFERWANKVFNPGAGLGMEVSLADFRRDVLLELLNEAGQVALVYKLYRCWPSEYVALAELDADEGGVAFQSLTLELEAWERDLDVPEPAEPSFEGPVLEATPKPETKPKPQPQPPGRARGHEKQPG